MMKVSTMLLFVLLAGCSSLNVNTQHDPYAPFIRYLSFDWVRTADQPMRLPADQQLLKQQLRFTLEQVLQAKGLVRDEQAPDLLIDFAGESEERTAKRHIERRDYRIDPRLYRDWHDAELDNKERLLQRDPRWVRETRTVETRMVRYTEGRLKVEFIDRHTGQAVWQAIIDGELSKGDPVKRLSDALREALKAYPPPS